MKAEDRLPPGQKAASTLPTLHTGSVPAFNPTTWDFRIWGEVNETRVLTWDQILSLPRTQVLLDVHCVTGWTVLDTRWEGISIRTLIKEGWFSPTTSAKYAMQHADFGYSTNLPLEVLLQDNFLLATHFNGKPLTPEHGYPLRAVTGSIPGRTGMKDVYFWKGVKWLRGLQLTSQDQPGFWEANSYHNKGDVWKEQRTNK